MRETGKKRVLLVIPNLGRGGAQQVFRQQLETLSKTFHVTACVFNWDDAFEEDHTINIVSLDVPAGNTTLAKVWYFALRIIRLKAIKRKEKIEVSISHLEGADYVNLLSAGKDTTLCWIHGTKKYDANIRGFMGTIRKKLMMPLLYRKADRIVSVSNGIANELASQLPEIRPKLRVIYNGFDVERITALSSVPLSDQFAPLFNFRTIITHCRFSRQKNLLALLAIFSRMNLKDSTKLVLVGDGEMRQELISYCRDAGLFAWDGWSEKRLDLTRHVYFIGQQRNPFNFLKAASLYVMTSNWEGFPLALCEAMVCGCPVVVADCFTGPREILDLNLTEEQPVRKPVKNQYGVLMPLASITDEGNIQTWINELEWQLSQSAMPSSEHSPAQQRIEKFSLSECNRQTIALIHELSK